MINDTVVRFRREGPHSLSVEIGGKKVAELELGPSSPDGHYSLSFYSFIHAKPKKEYHPIYLPVQFNLRGVPELVYSLVRGGTPTNIGVLRDDYGEYKLYYGDTPVYLMGRGVLKAELIRLALPHADPLLIDELENSLHPDILQIALTDIKRVGTQVVFTTNSNEVIKLAGTIFSDPEALAIYLTKDGYKTYDLSYISEFGKPLSWLGYV